MAARGRVTMDTIARDLGVSKMTVSRAFRGGEGVSEPVRRRVVAACRRAGYVLNRRASALSRLSSGEIGVVVTLQHGPVFVAALRDRITTEGYVMSHHTAGLEDHERYALQLCREFGVEGLVYESSAPGARGRIAAAARAGLPAVFVGLLPDPPRGVDLVRNDTRRAAEMTVEHLAGLGHRDLAIVVPRAWLAAEPYTAERLAGMRDAADRLGATVAVAPFELTPDGLRAGLRRLLRGRRRPDALVVSGSAYDATAEAAARAGIAIGRDLAVICQKEPPPSLLDRPAPTVVAIDETAVAAAVAGRLLQRIQRPDLPLAHVLVPPRLMVRASCGGSPAGPAPAVPAFDMASHG